MPNRILRPGINDSDRVDALSDGAEIFYRRLMSVVDDFGRFEADHRKLRSQCWPKKFDKISPSLVIEWLDECREGPRPLIVVYDIDDKYYLEIQGFDQRIKPGQKSKFPDPPGKSGIIPEKTASRARSPSPSNNASDSERTSDGSLMVPLESPPANFDFQDWAERIYARHPKKKDKFLALKALMFFAVRPACKAEFDKNHALWCSCEAWTDKQGMFAPRLVDWIEDEGWKHPPLNGKPPAREPAPRLPLDNRPLSEKFER